MHYDRRGVAVERGGGAWIQRATHHASKRVPRHVIKPVYDIVRITQSDEPRGPKVCTMASCIVNVASVCRRVKGSQVQRLSCSRRCA